eukprot:5845373-Pleurochrysis_carterae.AAC.6
MARRIPYASLSNPKGGGGLNLSDITGEDEGDILKYQGGEWLPVQPQDTGTLESLQDVQIDQTTLQSGQGITWGGSAFVNNSVINGQSTILSGLDDVAPSPAPSEGQILVFSGEQWRPGVVNADGSIALGINTTARSESVSIGNNISSAGERSVCIGISNATNGSVNNDLTLLGVAAGREAPAVGLTAVGGDACVSNSGKNATAVGYRSGYNGCGEESVSLGYYAGNNSGARSVSIGPNCTALGSNSIAINASGFPFEPSGSDSFFISPRNVPQAVGLALSDVHLIYNTSTGRVSRQTKTQLKFDGFDEASNATGVVCRRDITRNGRYFIDYSQYAHHAEIGVYPIVQVSLFTREEDEVSLGIIRNANVSYEHDAVNKVFSVYIGSGTTYRNDLHFNLICSLNFRVPFFFVSVGGEGDAVGQGVTRSTTSFVYS